MRRIVILAMLMLAGCGAPVADQPVQATQAAPLAEAAFGVGSTAPAFELPGSDGKTHKLANYVGEHVVLAFFPKAFTSG